MLVSIVGRVECCLATREELGTGNWFQSSTDHGVILLIYIVLPSHTLSWNTCTEIQIPNSCVCACVCA